MERIKGGAGEAQTTSGVIAVRKLKSGDLAVHVNSSRAKKEMEETIKWVKRIAPAAVVQKTTWPVLVHGVRVADYPRSAGEKNARRIETENNRLHPGLKIKDIRWLGYVEGEKEYASLIMRIDSATQANRLIQEGVVMRYDLKNAETYDPKYRVTQCFKCQQYGHISPDCTSQQRCGFCGGQHITEQCAEKSQTISKCCAASAIAASTVLRFLVGTFLPLAGPKLYAALGLGWGNSLLGFIVVALAPLSWIFFKYGERIRKSPRFQVHF
jgi:hypothetical protein